MARKSTPSFVLELPLLTTATDERALAIRLDAARNIYNACLGEALRRRDRMRESKAWRAARKLRKGPPDSEARKARAKAFKQISAAYGFSSGDVQRFAQRCRDACWIKDHLGGHDTQTTSLRLDASQARAAWPGAEALLRAASDGFEPASGRGFALPHVTLGVGAGRSRNPGQKVREAGEVYPQALASAARAPESGAILEIPDGT